MANISNADLTINWLPNISKAKVNATTHLDAINQIKASIITLGLFGDDAYGLSIDIWTDLLDSFKKSYNNPEQINDEVYTSGEGRWSFSSSIDNYSAFTQLIDTFEQSAQLSNSLEPFTFLLTNSVIKNLEQPDADKKFIENFYSFLPSATRSLLKDQQQSIRKNIILVSLLRHTIVNATELLYNAGLLDNSDEEISLLNISYNDYEPGVDFLEVSGEFSLTYNTSTKALSYMRTDGEVINNPSNDELYDHNFSDTTSEEIATEYLDMLNLNTTVENLNLTDTVIEDVCDNFTIATYMTEEIDSYVEEFTSIAVHVMGIISNNINDLDAKQRTEKIIDELDEIPPLDDYALESKINSFLEIIESVSI